MIASTTLIAGFVALFLPLGALTAATPPTHGPYFPSLGKRQNDTTYYPCGPNRPFGLVTPQSGFLLEPVAGEPMPTFQMLYCAPRATDNDGVLQDTPSINATVWLRNGTPDQHSSVGQVVALGLVPDPTAAESGSGYYGYYETLQLPTPDDGSLYVQSWTLTLNDLVRGWGEGVDGYNLHASSVELEIWHCKPY